MAKGALRTFFREDAGFPEEQPDLTDFLLDSMIQNGPRVGGVPIPTSGARVSSIQPGMRGYPGQQGTPGPVGAPPAPQMRRGPWGVPMPGQGPMQQPDVTVQAPAYPGMPGPMGPPFPMPQMQKPGWMDYLAQAGGAVADGFNARAGIRSNYFGGIGAQQQGLRDREFQHAMAERGAMENAARAAHEYEWRRYSAGRGEARDDARAAEKEQERALYQQLIGKRQEDEAKQSAFQKFMTENAFKDRFKGAGGVGDVDSSFEEALKGVRSPEELAILQEQYQQHRKPHAEAADLEAEINAVLRQLTIERMNRPGYGDSGGFGGLGLAYQLRGEAERIVKQRRGLK